MQGSGEYLAAVHVDILNARGESVLSAESNGPWFFAQLAPGDYAVKVTLTSLTGGDRTQQKSVHVDGSRQSSLDFDWRYGSGVTAQFPGHSSASQAESLFRSKPKC